MDWTSLFIVFGIIAYVASLYHRREVVQKARVAELRRGVAPSFEPPRPEAWRVATTGLVTIVLLVMTGWFAYMEMKSGKVFGAFAQVGVFFGLLFLVVLAMFINTLGRYMRKR